MSQEAIDLDNALAPILGIFLTLMFLFLPDMRDDFRNARKRRRPQEHAQRQARYASPRAARPTPDAEWETHE